MEQKIDRNQQIMVQDHFLYFTKCVNTYQRMFGLSNVDIGCRLKVSNKKSFCCETEEQVRWGNFKISVYSDWLADSQKNSDKEIRRVALHEILEIVLWEVSSALDEKYGAAKVETLIHRVINIIVNTLEPN